MLDSVFARGRGVAKAGVEYVLAKTYLLVDDDNKPILDEFNKQQFIDRDPLPEVVRGDPSETVQIIDGLTFKNRYTSGALSWAPGEIVTPEKESEIIDRWEKAHFAGLESDRYNILWVRQTHLKRHELHYIIPKVDLATGKSLNSKPPSHGYGLSNSFRRLINLENNWSDPDDPERARLSKTASNEELKSGFNRKIVEIRKDLEAAIFDRIAVGAIESGADVRAFFNDMGFEINRDSVSKYGVPFLGLSHPDLDRNMRMKGVIYGKDFSVERDIESKNSAARQRTPEYIQREIEIAERKLSTATASRLRVHEKKYKITDPATRIAEQAVNETGQISYVLDDSVRDSSLSNHLRRELNLDAIQCEKLPKPVDTLSTKNQRAEKNLGELQNQNKSLRLQQTPMRENSQQPKDIRWWLHDFRTKIIENSGEAYDRVRTKINGWFERFERTAISREQNIVAASGIRKSGIADARSEIERSFIEINTAFTNTSREFEKGPRDGSEIISRGVGAMRTNRSDELERFKTEINLPQFMANMGYEKDAKESSASSICMRCGNDKLIVTTDQRGHGIYFDVHDDSNNGTIIDFIQKLEGLNLGQVRKQLRPLVGIHEEINIKTRISKPKRTDKNFNQILMNVNRMKQVKNHSYLESRGIFEVDRRFDVLTDARNNVIFPHRKLDSSCSGYEIKNRNFTGFSPSSEKSFFATNNIESARIIYLVESGIDALSLANMQRDSSAAYISFGGGFSLQQVQGLKELLNSTDAEIVSAFDNDEMGEKYHAKVSEALLDIDKTPSRLVPVNNDWNDDLKAGVEIGCDNDDDYDMTWR